MRFDGNRAWTEAMAAARANREVLAVLAGVFLLLPQLAIALLYGDHQRAIYEGLQHLDDPVVKGQVQAHLQVLAPPSLLSTLVQLTGEMAILAMLTDPARPTVAEAIRIAGRAVPALIGTALVAALLYVVAGGGIAVVFGVIAGLTGQGAIASLAAVAVVALVGWGLVRLSLVMPAILVDRIGHPWRVIGRSLALTRGNAGRLGWFYLMLGLAYVVLVIAVGGAISALAALALGKGSAPVVEALVGAGLSAAGGAVFTAVIAMVHRQLAEG